MNRSKLITHHNGSVLLVILHCDVYQVVMQLQLLAIFPGTLHIGIKLSRNRIKCIGVAARLQISSKVGAVHTSREQDSDVVVLGIQLIELLLNLPVDIFGCLDRNTILIFHRKDILMLKTFCKINSILPYIAECHIGT